MQTQTQIEQAFSTALAADIRREEDRQVEAELNAEFAEQRAKDMMEEGNEFYPWTFSNFEEAIGNAPKVDRMIMFVYLAGAIKNSGLKNNYANEWALDYLKKLVENYWHECAMQEAWKRG